MDGIEGLKLVSITPNILSNTQIIFIKFIIVSLSITSILSLFISIKNNKESKARFIPPLILIFISAILIVMTITGLNNYKKNVASGNVDDIYIFEIVDDNYYIDSNIYKTLEIDENIIKIIKEKTKD